MAKTASSKKAKGTRLEKEIAKRLADVLGGYNVDAKRMPMSGAIEGFKGDIYTNLPVCIEVKNQEKLNFRGAWAQAKTQAGADIPVLMTSRNNDPEIICVIGFEDLLMFFELALQSGWSSNLRRTDKNRKGS